MIEDQDIKSLFLTFETKTTKLKFKNQSPVVQLFFNCFGNWRYLVTVRNRSELLRKAETFSKGLVTVGDNPFLYGSKKGQQAYFSLFIQLQASLNDWSIC